MTKLSLLILAQNGFQDVELEGVRKGLTEAGFEVHLASKETGICTGKFGGEKQATIAMRDINVNDYDRIAFIGGPGASELRNDEEAKTLARSMAASGKPFGAICIAPTIFAAAAILEGRKATVWDDDGSEQKYIEDHGAEFIDQSVVLDGLLITGNGPEAAEEFGREFAKMTV